MTIPRPKIASGVSEAVLLGASGYQSANGFTVTSVRNGSPADGAGVKAGDVMMRIDRQIVHSAAEIETALGTNVTGTITFDLSDKGNLADGRNREDQIGSAPSPHFDACNFELPIKQAQQSFPI